MRIAVKETEFFVRNLTLRLPFRFGIACMTHTPHLVVRSAVEIDGKLQHGFAADNLIPKWFTKNPDTSFCEEIEDMLEVIKNAASIARALPPMDSVFSWWREVYQAQEKWAPTRKFPPLLSGFGVTLIERMVIDAFCRATGQTFAEAVSSNALGMRLGDIHPELGARTPTEFLPPKPERTIIARHTVGMADSLGEDEGGDVVQDGLPHSLEEFIREQGLTHFKIKLSGDIEKDRARLRRIAEVIARHTAKCAFTLDGNENFRAVEPFRILWEGLRSDPGLERFLTGLIFVEQPFHRDVALSEATTRDLLAWDDRPPIIIDESGGTLDSTRVALAGGYAGSSHKNCKGIFHGIADACLIAQRRAAGAERPLHMCAEDLTNLGPVAVTQDLAVVATLGIRHVERNGHHYFAGLSQFPQAIQRDIFAHHGDLYTRHAAGYPVVRIEGGTLAIGSVVDAPFGVGFEPDLAEFTPLVDWRYKSMEGGARVENPPQLR